MSSLDVNKIIYYAQQAYEWSDGRSGMLQKAVKTQIDELIYKINILNLEEDIKKIGVLENGIIDKIKTYLYIYNKEELAIALLFFKAKFRSKISLSGNLQPDYEIINRHSEILWLISILLKGDKNDFKNKNLFNNSENLAMVFGFAYYFSIIKDNIKHYMFKQNLNKSVKVGDLNCFLKEGFFYSDEFNKYMDDMLKVGEMEIPDDTNIQDVKLNNFLHNEKLDKDSILNGLSEIISNKMAFSLNNLNCFCCYGLKQSPAQFYILESKQEYYNKLNLDCTYFGFENIIKLFSLNNLNNNLLNDIKNIELRSIYEIGDKIIFFPFDMVFNISCFEKFLTRKHFVEYFLCVMDKETQELIKGELSKVDSKISTYLSYVLADVLYTSGYKLPMEKGCPKAEINNITAKVNNQTINLLKNNNINYGDIDVLALNETKNEILNIELKYFSPLFELEDIYDPFKIKDRQKYIEKVKSREQVIKYNLPQVISFLGGNFDKNYTVRSIFITPRPDYWLLYDNTIEYIEWVDFMNRVKSDKV